MIEFFLLFVMEILYTQKKTKHSGKISSIWTKSKREKSKFTWNDKHGFLSSKTFQYTRLPFRWISKLMNSDPLHIHNTIHVYRSRILCVWWTLCVCTRWNNNLSILFTTMMMMCSYLRRVKNENVDGYTSSYILNYLCGKRLVLSQKHHVSSSIHTSISIYLYAIDVSFVHVCASVHWLLNGSCSAV